jgi:hypothetical protein
MVDTKPALIVQREELYASGVPVTKDQLRALLFPDQLLLSIEEQDDLIELNIKLNVFLEYIED